MMIEPWSLYGKTVTGNERLQALVLIRGIQEELARGTTHYHPVTEQELPTLQSIITCLREEGEVTFQRCVLRNDDL